MTTATGLSSLGYGSGLDNTSIISALVTARSQQLTAMQSKQTNLASATQAITSFASTMSALSSAAAALSSGSGFSTTSASSSDASVVTSASGTGAAGSYQVQVQSLAAEQRTFSDAQTSGTDPLDQEGTIGLNVGSNATISVSVSATDSLADVATKINASGARVSAAVIYDGSNYRLQVRGLDTGAANAVTFNEQGTTLGLSTPANTYQKASDSKFTVDGFSYTRQTNQITGAIDGVTLALTKPTTSPVTVTVAGDSTALATKVQSFVTAFNNVITAGHANAGFGTTTASNPLLAGDQAIRTSISSLTKLISQNASNTSGSYTSLLSIGLSITDTGTLSLDTTKFQRAMAADPTSVEKVFVTDAHLGASGMMSQFTKSVTSLSSSVTSPVQAELQGFNSQSRSLSDQITAEQARIAQYKAQLTQQFTNVDNIAQNSKTEISYFTSSSSSSG